MHLRRAALTDAAKRLTFRARGMRPMSPGYTAYKTREIKKALARPFEVASGWGFRIDERIIEYPWLFSRLPEGEGTLLDAGSALNFGYLLEQPKLASKKVYIATLAPEEECSWTRGVSYVFEDLRRMSFRDAWFDSVVSISTIEHIGMDNTLFYSANTSHREAAPQTFLDAIREYRRVLKKGGRLFLTVPFGRHIKAEWYQLFDAPMLDTVIEAFGPGRVEEAHYRYEEKGWVRSSREASKDCTYAETYRTHKSEADSAAAARAVACLELTAKR